ncbi:MAG: DUF1800 domain-containing protein [Saprospiraceae bacterium]|nr:DUF1800 domain-containing protein [Saprospiraceae bacterium]
MASTKEQQIRHLLWRAGFGPGSKTWPEWAKLTPAQAWSKLKADAAGKPLAFAVASNALQGVGMGFGEISRTEISQLTDEQKKQIRKQSREDLRSLNLLWLDEMSHTKAQLREKMALFWHGHFASRNINILYQQQLLEVVRNNALGNFGALLQGVSKSAAMLAFLNNQQNRKQSPNENFAREVMELFTLGRGHYTEKDIKEAARAFTGWGFNLAGDFVFRQGVHDTGAKTVLGKTGNLGGDDVLDILLDQRQTAYFITGKIYRFLVNEQDVPQDRIRQLGDRFYQNKYDIMSLLDDIFTSDWFYDEKNVGVKIKSPVELWVGIRRTLPLQLENPETQLFIQKALGQILFFPPNVAGWPGGKTWIDSSSLMLRLRIPQLLALGSDLDVNTKDDDDQDMGMGGARSGRQLRATIDWALPTKIFEKTPDQDLIPRLAEHLWQAPNSRPPLAVLEAYTDPKSRDTRLKSAIVQLMATPEYQVC